ncbi:Hypothetical predicted protein [Cloeon dipterum]|uniref:C2H2-type domain-containing protein n=1 Tax=Cloeon dipterum TaxID=197152 RepID=A0A8S1EFL5_9INSE|nr:Hypothetical predicted protein [Cloeon dipterum]
MADLSEKAHVPFEELKNFTCVANSFSELCSENIPVSEKEEIMIGLIDRYRCMSCEDLIGATEEMDDHITQCHSEEELLECNSGCGSYFHQTDMESHKAECGILCPVKHCKKKFAIDTGHFVHVHPCVTCTFHGCTTAFELTKNNEEDENEISDFLEHIITSHVWKKIWIC